MAGVSDRFCDSCGRRIEWRRKWARDWENVRYCSERCRRDRPGDLDRRLESEIRSLLEARARGATICPSEAARVVSDDWRPLMDRARSAARRLVVSGEVEVLQGGRVVDPSTAKGPIRIRRVR
ncbi:MAG: DUF2256 and DUF3253 domain-containing protein [Ilumatobacter sp.]